AGRAVPDLGNGVRALADVVVAGVAAVAVAEAAVGVRRRVGQEVELAAVRARVERLRDLQLRQALGGDRAVALGAGGEAGAVGRGRGGAVERAAGAGVVVAQKRARVAGLADRVRTVSDVDEAGRAVVAVARAGAVVAGRVDRQV